ncbi:hypothetical protein SYNTR_0368 [Candidatus Syntrophocurvum alkaliphilum]|uniref:Alkaline shock response membrane anchor protein AmaP n=1 Tax=Candidatus Syntrophocurvum alkaliphilum TaxID=2293317 RepID=A0A6I6DEP1_9FIRM|nr:alkaline shock response membrane anchor protein AmaP [Candidatus Syntrophocurvum alkaliphilum]QGT98961.1 hypothetical protein SYNTR_0368 [Candidatus Syntrophocurvum alkaliphilum]
MPMIWRTVLILYSLLLIFISGVALSTALGGLQLSYYIELALATTQNQIILIAVAVLLIGFALWVIVVSLKKKPKPQSVTVTDGVLGQVLITIPAIKVIIMKAVKQVEGLKEIKTDVKNTTNGLTVQMRVLINPDYNVPELSQNIQKTVKEHLHDIGGLSATDINVLIDDFYAHSKPAND